MTPHPPTPSFSIRRVLIAVGLCIGLAALLLSQARNLNEYWLYFTQDRRGASLDLRTLSEDWTESTLRERLPGHPIGCHPYTGPLPVQRACGVDVKAVNGVPAMFLSFFFAGGRLDQVAISVPWWNHPSAHRYLRETLGRPSASQVIPIDGVRLHGWDLGNGSAVFLNRDRPFNPLQWNGIYWRSATACRQQGCFRKP
jgi:hypothetical protein